MNRPTRLLALPVVALVAVLGACGNPPEEAKASFTQGGMVGVQFDNEVASFEADHQGDKVESIAQVLTKCAKLTVVDGKDRTR